MFSTEHKGSRITTLRPGARPGHFTAGMVARLLVTFLFWIGVAILVLPRLIDPIAAPAIKDLPAHWWWVIVIVVVIIPVRPDHSRASRCSSSSRRRVDDEDLSSGS